MPYSWVFDFIRRTPYGQVVFVAPAGGGVLKDIHRGFLPRKRFTLEDLVVSYRGRLYSLNEDGFIWDKKSRPVAYINQKNGKQLFWGVHENSSGGKNKSGKNSIKLPPDRSTKLYEMAGKEVVYPSLVKVPNVRIYLLLIAILLIGYLPMLGVIGYMTTLLPHAPPVVAPVHTTTTAPSNLNFTH